MTERDFQLLDEIIDNNKKYGLNDNFDEYFDSNLRDSLNEFIPYKVGEIDPNLDNDDWDNEENIKYKIFWQLIPFLKKKYYDVFYDYYIEYHRRRGNINESSINRTKQMILDSFDEIGYIKTIQKFKLFPGALDKLFPQGISKTGNMDDRCTIFEVLIKAFFSSGYLKGKTFFEYNNKSYEFEFYNDNHTGSLMVDIIDLDYKDGITVYATPFYEGYCELPIDTDLYLPEDGSDNIDISGMYQEINSLDVKQFKTFSDLTNWFNNDYPKIILKFINPFWDKYRNK